MICMSEKRTDLVHFRKNVWRVTQKQAAQYLGIELGRYVPFEYRADARIPDDILGKLRKLGYQRTATPGLLPLAPQEVGTLKVYGAISAGPGVANGEMDSYELTVPIEFARPDYSACIAENDSMMPYVQPRDTLVFKDYTRPLPERAFAVRLDGFDGLCIKETQWTAGDWELASWNPKYEPFRPDSMQLLGYLVGLISSDGALKLGPDDDGLTRAKFESYLRSRLF